jgi:hypothetical protein
MKLQKIMYYKEKETVTDPSDDFSSTVGTDESDSEWIVTEKDAYYYSNLNKPTNRLCDNY